MNIIQEKCFAKGWFDVQRQTMGRVDPGLLEKCVHALELVGQLVRLGIPFVFKGGTSMVLLLEDIRRLSIDVDIICSLPAQELESILSAIPGESRFDSFDPDRRDPDRLPKRSHYKFGYTSVVNGRPADILLDVLEEECLYPQTIRKPVAAAFAIPEQHVEVRLPTIECLTADKLTAFAPNTIGVKYSFRGASLKILKHCADVGALFDRCSNVAGIRSAYDRIWDVENSYRGSAFTREQVLDDTLETARLVSLIGLKGCPVGDEAEIIQMGIRQLDSHIIGKKFSRDEARLCAAKAAYLAAIMKTDDATSPIPCYDIEELKVLAATPLKGRYALLNRLRGGAPEAYYYWLKVLEYGRQPQ